jgi:hypothetical protein
LAAVFRWLLASSWLTNLGDGITLALGPLLVQNAPGCFGGDGGRCADALTGH